MQGFRDKLMNGAVFMAEGGPTGGGFSQEYVDGLKEARDTAKIALKEAVQAHKDEMKALATAHDEAMKALRTEHTTAIGALKGEHQTALDAAATAHTEALAAAKAEHETALTTAQTAARGSMVQNVLRAEATALGLLDMDQLKLLDPAEVAKLTVDDAGVVAGAKPLLEGVKKAKPFLFGASGTSNPSPAPRPGNPEQKHARDMTDAEFAEANRNKAWRTQAAA